MLSPSDFFAGPILRRASPGSVAIWAATTKGVALDGLVRVAGATEWIGETTTIDQLKVFEGLYVYLVLVTPKQGTFPRGTLLEYSLGTVGNDGAADHSWFPAVVAADGIAYAGFTLPTFSLQASGARLNVLYASCRKPHDIDGGDKDAMTYGDAFVSNNVRELSRRPTILCLNGDQIYADDVHDATFDALNAVAKTLEGSSPESMPGGVTVPGKGQRQEWVKKQARFTSTHAANHLVTFAEYVAAYGLALNVRNWPSGPLPGDVLGYRDGLRAVRRLLANTPTYMIFDDHDVTDDWNLSLNWIAEVNASSVGSRIVANALAAYWLFQAWGNDPAADAAVVPQMRECLRNRSTRPGELAGVVATKSALNGWEFATPTVPAVYFLDTRTNRGHVQGFRRADSGAPAYLKTPAAWLLTHKRLAEITRVQGPSVPLVLVAPAPILGFSTVDRLQQAASNVIGPTKFDFEGWAANQGHLFTFLLLCGDLDVVLLGGDVHYAFTSTASFSVFDGDFIRDVQAKIPSLRLPRAGSGSKPTYDFLYRSRFLQLNSSGAKNYASVGTFGLSKVQGETGFIIDSELGVREGRFKDPQLYELKSEPAVPAVLVKVKTSDVKPNFVLQQRINDALNSPYIAKHNIGYVSFTGRKIDNGFLVDGALTSPRSWDFASGGAWVPTVP